MSYNLEVKMPAVEMSGSDEFFISLTDLGQKYRDSWTELGVPKTKFFLEANRKTYYGQELEQFLEDNYKDETMEEIHLADGGAIMQELRETIFENTGIVCSVGVGANQLMAKVACKLNKPDAVTCLTKKGFFRIANRIQFRDVTGFGGDLGEELQSIYGGCSLKNLQNRVKENPTFLRGQIGPEKFKRVCDIMNGVCDKPVKNKFMNNAVNCGKRNLHFDNKSDFKTKLNYLAQNFVHKMNEEYELNSRKTTCVKVQYSYSNFANCQQQKTFTLDPERLHPDSSVWKNQQEFKRFYDAVIDTVVNGNPYFNADMPTINSINFNASQFNEVTFLTLGNE